MASSWHPRLQGPVMKAKLRILDGCLEAVCWGRIVHLWHQNRNIWIIELLFLKHQDECLELCLVT